MDESIISRNEGHFGPTGEGSVLADIGGDRGALVIYTPRDMDGAELEIVRSDSGMRMHVAVRERQIAGGSVFAAFYPSLMAGEYRVEGSNQTVSVSPSRVLNVSWALCEPEV
jgi:hypothetical protein